MCMDSRKALRIPNDFAFVLRTRGRTCANNEFASPTRSPWWRPHDRPHRAYGRGMRRLDLRRDQLSTEWSRSGVGRGPRLRRRAAFRESAPSSASATKWSRPARGRGLRAIYRACSSHRYLSVEDDLLYNFVRRRGAAARREGTRSRRTLGIDRDSHRRSVGARCTRRRVRARHAGEL